MESIACENVDIQKFLSSKEPTSKITEVKWKCSDFALKMLAEGIYADITFKAINGSVKAHRNVLACVCPSLLAASSEHYGKGLCTSPIIVHMPIEALKLILLLLYTTNEDNADVEVPQLSRVIEKHFAELHWAIIKYDVEKRLGFVLLPALARQLTPHNCWYYYEKSLTAKHVPYKSSSTETCYNHILGNYAEVIMSESFLEQMKWNRKRVYRIIKHAESQAARQEALRSFQAICNPERTDITKADKLG